MNLRQRALDVLQLADPEQKTAATAGLVALLAASTLDQASLSTELAEAPGVPGRPARPRLVAPRRVASRSVFTLPGRVALLHAVAHIEFNAVNLALDAVWRFPGLPEAYYRDWVAVAGDEARHFTLVRDHLRSMGFDYGDFDAHDGLWLMAQRTACDCTARMALVPRTLEARGLDATPALQAKLARAGDTRAAQILALILRDEVGHVAVGNRWYRWLCTRAGLDPVSHYEALLERHQAPRPRPPFNWDARRAAGFTAEELGRLQ
jgi:uncharacterized ferritin-like protein (DUF455 family)